MENDTHCKPKASTTKKSNPVLAAVAVFLLIVGIAIIVYPYFCQFLYKKQAEQVNHNFNIQIKETYTPEEIDILYERMVLYNRQLFETGQVRLVDAFSYEQVDFSLLEFGFREEMIGYLSIPKINIELPIYLGANRTNLNRGAAHLTQTSLPVGGQNVNTVIAAHRGMPSAAMFRDIEKLEADDLIYITNYRETLTYRVAEVAVILPTEFEKILIQEERDMVTLITCHPYGFNYERYVVYAERIMM